MLANGHADAIVVRTHPIKFPLKFYNYELCVYIYTVFVFSSINYENRFANLLIKRRFSYCLYVALCFYIETWVFGSSQKSLKLVVGFLDIEFAVKKVTNTYPYLSLESNKGGLFDFVKFRQV